MTTETDVTYSYSTDGGEYYMGNFATRAEALEEAREDDSGRVVRTGVQVPFSFAVDVAGFVDALRDQARDHAGDVSEDWLDRVSCAEVDDLSAALTAAFVAWMEKYGHTPTFYGIDNVETHPAPAGAV